MNAIKDKIRVSKIGNKNPNAKAVKCFNIITNQEIAFDTVEQCRLYFGEHTHRFITTRVRGQTKSPYKREWKIAYLNEPYYDFTIRPVRKRKSLQNINSKDKQNTCEKLL